MNLTLLRIIGAIGLALLLLNMFAIIYIVKNYIIRLKIKSKFVLAFYSLSFVVTLLMIVQFMWNVFFSSYPRIDVDAPNQLSPNNILDSAIKAATFALGFCIIATMFKIAVCLQYVLGEIDYC